MRREEQQNWVPAFLCSHNARPLPPHTAQPRDPPSRQGQQLRKRPHSPANSNERRDLKVLEQPGTTKYFNGEHDLSEHQDICQVRQDTQRETQLDRTDGFPAAEQHPALCPQTSFSSTALPIPTEKVQWPWQVKSCGTSPNPDLVINFSRLGPQPTAIKLSDYIHPTCPTPPPGDQHSAAHQHFSPCCPAGTGAEHSSQTFPAELPPPALHTPPTDCFTTGPSIQTPIHQQQPSCSLVPPSLSLLPLP